MLVHPCLCLSPLTGEEGGGVSLLLFPCANSKPELFHLYLHGSTRSMPLPLACPLLPAPTPYTPFCRNDSHNVLVQGWLCFLSGIVLRANASVYLVRNPDLTVPSGATLHQGFNTTRAPALCPNPCSLPDHRFPTSYCFQSQTAQQSYSPKFTCYWLHWTPSAPTSLTSWGTSIQRHHSGRLSRIFNSSCYSHCSFLWAQLPDHTGFHQPDRPGPQMCLQQSGLSTRLLLRATPRRPPQHTLSLEAHFH